MATKICNIKKYFKFERLNLDVAGFYPGDCSKTYFTQVLRIFLIFIALFQSEAMIHFMYKNRHDLVKVSFASALWIEYAGFLCKYLSLHKNKSKFLILEKILESDELTIDSEEGYKLINELLRRLSLVTITFQGICVSSVMCIWVMPVFKKSKHGEENIYPLPCSFPFNPDDFYGLVYFGEMVSIFCGAWLSSTFDNIFVKFMTIGTAHFAILAAKVRNLSDKNIQLNDKQIYGILRECVVYQQTVICYISELQKIFSTGIFAQFVCSGMVICLTGFQLLVNTMFSGNFNSAIIYLCAMLTELILYCWYGQLVMEKSDDLSNACYETNWHEMSVKNQKMLILIMEKSKKPTIIKAGGFFDLNIKCLMAILRSSYSYFAILRQVYNKSTNVY